MGTPTGAGNCTYNYEEAGFVSLDDVVGIDNGGDPLHKNWCRKGCNEYLYETNRGRCTHFWDDKKNRKKNQARIDAVDAAFKRKYPDMPSNKEMPGPMCDFNRQRFYANNYNVFGGRRLDLDEHEVADSGVHDAREEEEPGSFLDTPYHNWTMGVDPRPDEDEATNETRGRRLEFTYCISNYNGE